MAYKNASTAREILQLRKDIEQLKAARGRANSRWFTVEIETWHETEGDKAAEIGALEAAGHNVMIRLIRRPDPHIDDGPLPPNLKLIGDEAARQREQAADQYRAMTKDEERPFPLAYPKQVF